MSEAQPDPSCREHGGSPIHEIVETVAHRADESPLELPPLYDYVDPALLDTLEAGERHPNRSYSVVFDYYGYEITVDSDGTVTVTEQF